jgi:DNA-binding beta-propeller fold protein YncE
MLRGALLRSGRVAALGVAILAVASSAGGAAGGSFVASSPRVLPIDNAEPATASRSISSAAWIARYALNRSLGASGKAVAISPNGKTVYVAGSTEVSRRFGPFHITDYVTIAYKVSTGRRLWAVRYGTSGNGSVDPSITPDGIAVSPDGSRVYVSGDSGTGRVTVAYRTTNGARLWVARYGASNLISDSSSHLIAVSPNGRRVYLSDGSGRHLFLLTYNAATGALVRVERYAAPKGYLVAPRALALSPDGSEAYISAGLQQNSPRNDWFLTLAYNNSTGALTWHARYANAEPTGAAVSPDGTRVLVTGLTNGPEQYATVSYGATTGSQEWATLQPNPYGGYDAAEAVAVSPDGSRVYVSGEMSNSENKGVDFATIAYSAESGVQLWLSRYVEPGTSNDDYVSSLVASPDGTKVFVAGTTRNANYSRWSGQVLGYHAGSGSQLWLNSYNGPLHRRASFDAMTASPDSTRVIVTGMAQISLSTCSLKCGKAVATIAYNAG